MNGWQSPNLTKADLTCYQWKPNLLQWLWGPWNLPVSSAVSCYFSAPPSCPGGQVTACQVKCNTRQRYSASFNVGSPGQSCYYFSVCSVFIFSGRAPLLSLSRYLTSVQARATWPVFLTIHLGVLWQEMNILVNVPWPTSRRKICQCFTMCLMRDMLLSWRAWRFFGDRRLAFLSQHSRSV